ncbi:hypothetical protein HAX54_005624 [Datura stramonium]|uniref:Uncharacterized protein n=1 Tax=Datura stramonium TaxID=4076 RepID=A0ABS8T937_DATST|nr:hypothetical protein [Datura stramonium]
MAAVSRLQSLINKTSLQNLIRRHLLHPAASAQPFSISPEFQPAVHFDLQKSKSILTGHFSDNNKLSSNANEFVLNWNFPIGVSALPTFDLSLMELRGSRSTSSKKRPVPEEDVEDYDENDFDDDDDDDDFDDGSKSFHDEDYEYGSGSDSGGGDDDDNYGGRGGGAYTV